MIIVNFEESIFSSIDLQSVEVAEVCSHTSKVSELTRVRLTAGLSCKELSSSSIASDGSSLARLLFSELICESTGWHDDFTSWHGCKDLLQRSQQALKAYGTRRLLSNWRMLNGSCRWGSLHDLTVLQYVRTCVHKPAKWKTANLGSTIVFETSHRFTNCVVFQSPLSNTKGTPFSDRISGCNAIFKYTMHVAAIGSLSGISIERNFMSWNEGTLIENSLDFLCRSMLYLGPEGIQILSDSWELERDLRACRLSTMEIVDPVCTVPPEKVGAECSGPALQSIS